MDDLLLELARQYRNRYYGKYRGFVTDNNDPEKLGPQDVVIVAVKGQNLPEVAAGIAGMLLGSALVGFVYGFATGAAVGVAELYHDIVDVFVDELKLHEIGLDRAQPAATGSPSYHLWARARCRLDAGMGEGPHASVVRDG